MLIVPQQVAETAASLLEGPMEELTGIVGFFYGSGDECVQGLSRAELDDALPALQFLIPDTDGQLQTVSPSAASAPSASANACASCMLELIHTPDAGCCGTMAAVLEQQPHF